MRFVFFYAILLLGLFPSCEQIKSYDEKIITYKNDAGSDTVINKIHEATDCVNTDKLLFIAKGSEPGWTVEFYTHTFKLVVDYGKDSLVLKNQNFEIMKNDEDFIFTEEEKNQSVSVTIKNQTCKEEASGYICNKKVSVSFKGKIYEGCGTYLNNINKQ